METATDIDITSIVDSLRDGLYVCDLERRIIYWSKSAERITGWTAEDVLRRQCFDNVLCHIDKDGHLLCGQEYCPLHRSMITGTGSPAARRAPATRPDFAHVRRVTKTGPAGNTARFPPVNATRANVGPRGRHLPDRGQAAIHNQTMGG